jgi:hypothetical protein
MTKNLTITHLLADDDDDMSDSTSDEERTNESLVDDDETFPKEAIDTQPVVKKEIGPVKAYSSSKYGIIFLLTIFVPPL